MASPCSELTSAQHIHTERLPPARTLLLGDRREAQGLGFWAGSVWVTLDFEVELRQRSRGGAGAVTGVSAAARGTLMPGREGLPPCPASSTTCFPIPQQLVTSCLARCLVSDLQPPVAAQSAQRGQQTFPCAYY